MELEDALRRFPLPMLVEANHVNENAHGSLLNLVGDELHIIEKYDDIFLKVNTITDGERTHFRALHVLTLYVLNFSEWT